MLIHSCPILREAVVLLPRGTSYDQYHPWLEPELFNILHRKSWSPKRDLYITWPVSVVLDPSTACLSTSQKMSTSQYLTNSP